MRKPDTEGLITAEHTIINAKTFIRRCILRKDPVFGANRHQCRFARLIISQDLNDTIPGN